MAGVLWAHQMALRAVDHYDVEKEVRQVIADASAERPQTRKVRASQGRMPDNVRWR